MFQLSFPNLSRTELLRRLGRCGPVACVALLLGAEAVPVGAQPASSVASVSEAEARRRATQINQAGEQIQKAQALLEQRKVEEALALYAKTYSSLPDIPLARQHRAAARSGYVTAGCLRAQELAAKGDLAGANKILEELLAPAVAPGDSRVVALQRRLADPDRFPPGLTEAHVANVETVKSLLVKAASFHELGDYDKAISTYQDVLRVDSYNSAARRGLEAAEAAKSKYYTSAADHNRAKMLNEVDKTWEDNIPLSRDMSTLFGASGVAATRVQKTGRDYLLQKLDTLIFPKIDFTGVTLDEAVELLRVRSRDLDPEGKGVGFIVNAPPETRNKTFSLSLQSVPLVELLRYISETVGAHYKVDDYAVTFTSISERSGTIITRTFRVPPDFIQNSPVSTDAPPPKDPFTPAAGNATATGGLAMQRLSAQDVLAGRGVIFPEGASAHFNSSTSTLTVRNTVENMELVETLVEQASKSAPKMAVIQVKMIEVNQTNLDELGFDWLMGAGALPAGKVFVGGGNAGSGNTFNAANYPFNSTAMTAPLTVGPNIGFPSVPVQTALGGPLPQGVVTTSTSPQGGGPLTSGLRSGTYAVTGNTLDTLLKTGSTGVNPQVAPGVLSVAGVFTNPQFQSVLRGLSQKKGIDINASPSVTTKNGVKATVEVVREFIYPTEFDPPQLPQGGGRVAIGAPASQMIATPTTPTAFEMRRTGVVIEVEPIISDDGRTVELAITPELTDFEGFINYGSPILAGGGTSISIVQFATAAGNNNTAVIPVSQPDRLITPNLILQPVFKTQRVATAVKVWDGATIVLGGAKMQQRTLVNDKVPIVGDLPFVGRFFRSDTTQTETKNVIIFVTVNVVDPSGQKINNDTAAVSQATDTSVTQ